MVYGSRHSPPLASDGLGCRAQASGPEERRAAVSAVGHSFTSVGGRSPTRPGSAERGGATSSMMLYGLCHRLDGRSSAAKPPSASTTTKTLQTMALGWREEYISSCWVLVQWVSSGARGGVARGLGRVRVWILAHDVGRDARTCRCDSIACRQGKETDCETGKQKKKIENFST